MVIVFDGLDIIYGRRQQRGNQMKLNIASLAFKLSDNRVDARAFVPPSLVKLEVTNYKSVVS